MSTDTLAVEQEGRRRFHLALLGVFALVLSPFVSWFLALQEPKDAATPWRGRLHALAVIDTLVTLCLVSAMAHGSRSQAPEHPRIGVTMSADEGSGGVRIASVAPASPAEHAGIRVGDTIASVDGTPLQHNDELAKRIDEGKAGAARSLHVKRVGSEFDVQVTPVLGLTSAPQAPEPLFAHAARSDAPWSAATMLHEMSGSIAALMALGLVALLARRRGARARPLVAVALGLLLPMPVLLGVAIAFQRTVGLSLGALLLSTLAGGLTMLAVAAVGVRWMRPDASLATDAPLATLPAFLFGAFYAYAGSARVLIVISVLAPLLHLPDHPSAEVFGVSMAWGPGGIALFAVSAALVAPIAEEWLFRGILLPWMATWMHPVSAIFASAAVFGIGHLYYGASVLVPVVYGLALGWCRVRTGRLRAGVALHMFLNGSATIALILKDAQ